MSADETHQQAFRLAVDKELRITIDDPSKTINVELLDGAAEVFGAEMIAGKINSFTTSFAVSTTKGCSLKISGQVYKKHIGNVNRQIHDLCNKLEEYRSTAEKRGTKGPVTLVVGPTDAGKSTLCRTLLNHAARYGRQPLFVDLDVGQSSISIPGTIGTLPIETPEDIVNGFNDQKLSVYFFGYKSPGLHIFLYYLLIDKLGHTLQYRMRQKEFFSSGALIDTCGWINGHGYKSLLVAARSFDVNMILVVKDRKLYTDLKHDLSRHIKIIFVSELSGVIARNQSKRTSNRDELIHRYFYGSDTTLAQFTFDIKFTDIQIFSVTFPPIKAQHDALEEGRRHISIEPVLITPDLKNEVLAVSYADEANEDVILTSVLGFICIKNVDMDQKVVTILSPQPSPLPKRILLKGDLKIKDQTTY